MTDEAAMDAIADMVADGRTLEYAQRRLGISKLKAAHLWMRICARLGPQAR